MKITYLMIATYILDCVLIRTKPCKYFQLNSPVFNAGEGIFSKIEIDSLIPEKWRLPQFYEDGEKLPKSYPVFVKPEWGQNSSGIFRVDDEASLLRIREEIKSSEIKYLVQQAAPGKLEFEVFSMLHDQDKDQYAHLTITQTINESESYPVNGIFNSDTRYCEITEQFSEQQLQDFWMLLGEIGRFGISRVGLRADSVEDMLSGKFHVIEINLFLPMPINMLDPRYGFFTLWKMLRKYMMSLARITKSRNKQLEEKPVFTKIMLYNRSHPILKYIREVL
jgi:hypothetical protein